MEAAPARPTHYKSRYQLPATRRGNDEVVSGKCLRCQETSQFVIALGYAVGFESDLVCFL